MDLSLLDTERINEASVAIDRMSTLDMVTLMNSEDKKVALAVEAVLPNIAAAIEAICQRMQKGGRLVYVGAGTSGRIGVLDASECPPTFGVPEGRVVGLIAGGDAARGKAIEGAEDDEERGAADLRALPFTEDDALVGLAASGRTPYVLGAMSYAREVGGLTVSVACVRGAKTNEHADIVINPLTGPEVVTGSTRLKAGTAQKMVLNMLSTGVMIKLGKVYGNQMVDVKATNAKLYDRARRIVRTVTGAEEADVTRALEVSGYSAKHAICMILAGVDYETARSELEAQAGHLSAALTALGRNNDIQTEVPVHSS